MKLGSVESQQDPALLLSCSPAGAVPTLQDGLAPGEVVSEAHILCC